jgi:hypothetical protein
MTKTKELTQESVSDSVKAISQEILADNRAMNSLLEKVEDKEVKVHFGTHYVDVKKNIHGMEQLLVSIMQNANAVVSISSEITVDEFGKRVYTPTERKEFISKGMLFNDIEKRFRQKAGKALNRYGKQSVYTYLIQKMPYVVKYKMLGEEDNERTSRVPRVRYALLADSIPTFAEPAQIDFQDENEDC